MLNLFALFLSMANQCSIIMAYSFYSAVGNISDFEDNDPVSDTIPDQSLSVRDIIHRYTRGQIEIPPVDQGEDQDIESLVQYPGSSLLVVLLKNREHLLV